MLKLASLTGYTAGSARFALGQLKTKIKKYNDGKEGATPKSTPKSTPKKPAASKTPTSRGKRAASSVANVDGTPTKKRAKKSAEKVAVQEQDNGDEDEGDFKHMIKTEIEDDNDDLEELSGPDVLSI